MTRAEAFKKLVAAYGLKFKVGNDSRRTWHCVIFPHGDCNRSYCLLSGKDYTATLTPDFNANLFGNKSLGLCSLNEIIENRLCGRLCSECTAKYKKKLIDYRSLEELDIMLTLMGANHR